MGDGRGAKKTTGAWENSNKGLEPQGKTILKKKIAIDLYASNPDLSMKDLADQVGCSVSTVSLWFRQGKFIDKVYNRYMEISGLKLPGVVDAMIREALEGNVQAGRLVLEHFGKLDKRLKIQIESPFEKFLKASPRDDGSIEEAEIVENIDETKFISNLDGYVPDFSSLPERNKEANSKLRAKNEKEGLKNSKKSSYFKEGRKKINENSYKLKKRAENVSLKRLIGRPKKHKKREWMKQLEKLEIEKFGKIQK